MFVVSYLKGGYANFKGVHLGRYSEVEANKEAAFLNKAGYAAKILPAAELEKEGLKSFSDFESPQEAKEYWKQIHKNHGGLFA